MPSSVKASAAGARRSRARQSEVIATATKLFHEKGYEATSVQDIADELGILKGSVYYYIDSKEDLLFHIIEEGHERLVQQVDDVLAQNGLSHTEALREFIVRHVQFVAGNLPMIGIFFNDFRAVQGERREAILEARDRYEKRIRGILAAGQETGEFRSDMHPSIASLGILGMTNWLYQWFREGGDLSAEQVADELASLGISGVLTSTPERDT